MVTTAEDNTWWKMNLIPSHCSSDEETAEDPSR